jgi:hypothetical protein
VAASDGDDPSVALEWQHERPATPAAAGPEAEYALPVTGRVVWNAEDGGGIGQVDADDRLFRPCAAQLAQEIQRRRSAPGGVDD